MKTARPNVSVRPSIQAIVAAQVILALRPVTSAIPLNPTGVWLSRRLVSSVMAAVGPPLRGTRVTAVEQDGVRGEWVCAPSAEHRGRAIFYVHGSGYVLCSPRTHRGLASRLSEATGLPVFVCDYRLAPEHRFPAAADDVGAAYRWLLEQGFSSENIILAGDSAGGHLAVDLLLENARQGQPQPACTVVFSPLIDLTMALAAEQERRRRDPMISAKAAAKLVALYTRDRAATEHRLSLALDETAGLPPIFVQAGGAEMLSADARHLKRSVDKAGGSCTLEIWPGQMHVFQAMPLLIPEASDALHRAADFIAGTFADAHLEEVS